MKAGWKRNKIIWRYKARTRNKLRLDVMWNITNSRKKEKTTVRTAEITRDKKKNTSAYREAADNSRYARINFSNRKLNKRPSDNCVIRRTEEN